MAWLVCCTYCAEWIPKCLLLASWFLSSTYVIACKSYSNSSVCDSTVFLSVTHSCCFSHPIIPAPNKAQDKSLQITVQCVPASLTISLYFPSWIKMPHSSRMDPSHNPLQQQQQQQQQQQHQALHGNSNMGGPGGPMHSRNSSQNPRMHTDSFGLGGPGGPGDVPEPPLDVSQNQSSIPD